MCESKNYQFNNLDGIVPNTQYLGDASKADWVSSGTPLSYNNSVLLTMAEGTVGTLLASTQYVWYGKVTATLSTSAGAGVVTAFILLSDVKDEIDFEFVGVELTTAQTNFYSQGIDNCESIRNALTASKLTYPMQIQTERMQPSRAMSTPTSIPTSSTGILTQSHGPSMAVLSVRCRERTPGMPPRICTTILKLLLGCSCPCGLEAWPPMARAPLLGLVGWCNGTARTWQLQETPNTTTQRSRRSILSATTLLVVQTYKVPSLTSTLILADPTALSKLPTIIPY